ncbi:MAG: hypothetical protein IJ741_02435 [Schwartzia sp.]|nr:hypothetical protein [Schwartzia sp. (in: firmicutes)]MBR1760023.1 hypothetical protein [Schwartzia sp. (in: firmicutes)]
MEKFLSIYGRGGVWTLKALAGCTLVGAAIFLLFGEELLIGGLFVGYFAGGIFCWTLTNRMEEGHFDQEKAASQLQNGLFIRMGSLCLIMGLAAQVSKPFFLVALAAYLLFLGVAFACLIAVRVRKQS